MIAHQMRQLVGREDEVHPRDATAGHGQRGDCGDLLALKYRQSCAARILDRRLGLLFRLQA